MWYVPENAYRHILVVDDDKIIRGDIVGVLTRVLDPDDRVEQASDGEEALRIIMSDPLAFVFADMRMNGMDGAELARLARERFPWIQFCVLSNYDEFEGVKSAFKEGAIDYVLKYEIDAPTLLELVRRGREAFNEAIQRHKTDICIKRLGDLPESIINDKCCPGPVADAMNYALDHLNDALSQSAMARRVGYSRNHFCRLFKQYAGESYTAWINRKRIERACVFMRDFTIPPKDAASHVGFSDMRYFRRMFLRSTGLTISQWLENEDKTR